MKNLILILLATFTTHFAQAESIELKGTEAGALIGILNDSGIRPFQMDAPKNTWSLFFLSCEYRHNGALDGLFAGVPSYSCHGDFSHLSPIASHALMNYLERYLETDCAMGKCYLEAKEINCSVDTSEYEFVKRMQCTLITK